MLVLLCHCWGWGGLEVYFNALLLEAGDSPRISILFIGNLHSFRGNLEGKE